MPPSLGFVDRVPFPTLRNYVLMSLSVLGLSLLFAWSNAKDFVMESLNSSKNLTEDELNVLFGTLNHNEYNQCLILALTSQFWTVCTLINMCYCCMALLGKGIQIAVFGDLRVSEIQQLKERFWNFVFYKFIFIFGVLNVQYMNEAFLWTAWYSLLCFFQLLAQLCKFRFEYLSCSPATPKSQHVKLVFLLTLIFLASICLTAGAVIVGLYTDWNVCGFLMAECLLLIIRTSYVIIKYTVYLVDINHEGLWETRGTIVYYTELICEISMLMVDFLHYLHMVIWSNIFLSMASIVIWMQIRFLFTEIRKRITRHRSYLKIVKSMEARFTVATEEDIRKYDDNCAICWDKMQRARKLPCGHMFHNSCLRSWLAQDISCPTCRVSLSEQKTESPAPEDANTEVAGNAITTNRMTERPARPERRVNRTNHLFHFDASRYISWLPSFSVEVTHTQGQPRDNAQLDTMAEEVQRVFPALSLTSILEDLRATHSVEITIDNILEGRVVIMPNNDTSSEESDSDDSYNSSMGQQRLDVGDSQLPLYEASAPCETASLRASNDPPSLPDLHLRQRLLQDEKVEHHTKTKQQFSSQSESTSQDPTSEDGKYK